MGTVLSRRQLLQATGAAGVLPSLFGSSAAQAPRFSRMPSEGKDTPKICLGAGSNTDEAGMRRLKQIGVNQVLMGGPPIPWDEADISSRIERFKAGGLTLCNLMV